MREYANKMLRSMADAQVRNPSITVNDFHQGDKVVYVPAHAFGDLHHVGCLPGIVVEVGECSVVVDFGRGSELIPPKYLVKRS